MPASVPLKFITLGLYIPHSPLLMSPSASASQAASRPLVEKCLCSACLSDCFSRSKTLPFARTTRFQGTPTRFLPCSLSPVHNFHVRCDRGHPAHLPRRISPLSCGKPPTLDLSSVVWHTSHPAKNEQRVENRKKWNPPLFSVFNRTYPGPYLAGKVKRGFLALALRKSGLDF